MQPDPEVQPKPIPLADPPPSPLKDAQPNALAFKRMIGVQLREFLVGWTQVMANSLVPAALLLAALGFWADLRHRHQDAATRQVELFYDENLGHARSVLFSLWDGSDLSVLANAQSRRFIDAFVSRTIAASAQDPREISAAIVNLGSYFDRVDRCIERGLCDVEVVLTQLGDYGRDFYCLYAGQIATLRSNTLVLSVGEGLAHFADRAGGCAAESR